MLSNAPCHRSSPESSFDSSLGKRTPWALKIVEDLSFFSSFPLLLEDHWTSLDMSKFCRALWQRENLPAPPEAFAVDALKKVRAEDGRSLNISTKRCTYICYSFNNYTVIVLILRIYHKYK